MTKSNSIQRIGSCGIFHQPTGDSRRYITANFCQKLRFDSAVVDAEFGFFWLTSAAVQRFLKEQATGTSSSLQNINGAKIKATPIAFPGMQEQRRIVARIKECMEKIEEINESRSRALIEAEALAPSLYGAIDKSGTWPRKKIADLISGARNGKSIRQDSVNGDGHVLSLRAVRGVSLDLAQRKPIVLPEDIAAKYPIAAGDVFVSRANTIGLVGLASVAVDTPPDRLIYPDLLIKLTPNRDVIRPRFLAYALRTPESRKQIRARAVGTSQSMVKISGGRLKDVAVCVPPLSEQDELLERFDCLHDLSSELTANLRNPECEQLRAAVLRRAFAGEL